MPVITVHHAGGKYSMHTTSNGHTPAVEWCMSVMKAAGWQWCGCKKYRRYTGYNFLSPCGGWDVTFSIHAVREEAKWLMESGPSLLSRLELWVKPLTRGTITVGIPHEIVPTILDLPPV